MTAATLGKVTDNERSSGAAAQERYFDRITVQYGGISELRRALDGYHRVAVVSQENIPRAAADGSLMRRVLEDLRGAGISEAEGFYIPDGEEHKNMCTVMELCRKFSEWRVDRDDVIVGLGGGVVTDVAGLAASIYHRGVDAVHVPTTLIGQIDAGIGGKTGVNGSGGVDGSLMKNIVGTVHQPQRIICDPAVMETLSQEDWECGLGEMAKYHLLQDELGVDFGRAGIDRWDPEDVTERVRKCAEAKSRVVELDEHDTNGTRALLNYGHTVAHGLESCIVGLKHGAAVAIGVMFEACLAYELDLVGEDVIGRHLEVLSGYGLSWGMPEGISLSVLEERMSSDKKTRGSGARYAFVLPGASNGGRFGVLRGDKIEPEAVARAFRRHADLS